MLLIRKKSSSNLKVVNVSTAVTDQYHSPRSSLLTVTLFCSSHISTHMLYYYYYYYFIFLITSSLLLIHKKPLNTVWEFFLFVCLIGFGLFVCLFLPWKVSERHFGLISAALLNILWDNNSGKTNFSEQNPDIEPQAKLMSF